MDLQEHNPYVKIYANLFLIWTISYSNISSIFFFSVATTIDEEIGLLQSSITTS